MDHPHVQQRGFPVVPVSVQQQRPPLLQTAFVPPGPVSGSCQGRESLLARALRRDPLQNEEEELREKGLGYVESVAPKPILRRASCVESCVVRVEERGDQEKDETVHPAPIFPPQQSLASALQHQQSTTNQQQPPLARKTSLKFAIAPPPIHGNPPLHPHTTSLLDGTAHPGSRRGSVDAAALVGEGEQGDVVERVIGDIEEDDEDAVEDDDDESQDEEEDQDDEEEEEEDGEYADDSISIHDGSEPHSSEPEDEDRYSSTNWSGYEEDSEAGLSDEELGVKETLVVSPVQRRRVSSRGSAEDVAAFG